MEQPYKNQATGTIITKSWEENTWDGQPWNEVSGAKLTKASVTTTFQGDIEGESNEAWLMVYRSDTSADFVGLEQVTGQLAGRSGSFVLQHSGTYDNGKLHSSCLVVPGSGSGELTGLRGEGRYVFDGQHGDPTRYTLAYDFD